MSELHKDIYEIKGTEYGLLKANGHIYLILLDRQKILLGNHKYLVGYAVGFRGHGAGWDVKEQKRGQMWLNFESLVEYNHIIVASTDESLDCLYLPVNIETELEEIKIHFLPLHHDRAPNGFEYYPSVNNKTIKLL